MTNSSHPITTTSTWSLAGELVSLTDGNGVTIDFESDELGQTVGITDALGEKQRGRSYFS